MIAAVEHRRVAARSRRSRDAASSATSTRSAPWRASSVGVPARRRGRSATAADRAAALVGEPARLREQLERHAPDRAVEELGDDPDRAVVPPCAAGDAAAPPRRVGRRLDPDRREESARRELRRRASRSPRRGRRRGCAPGARPTRSRALRPRSASRPRRSPTGRRRDRPPSARRSASSSPLPCRRGAETSRAARSSPAVTSAGNAPVTVSEPSSVSRSAVNVRAGGIERERAHAADLRQIEQLRDLGPDLRRLGIDARAPAQHEIEGLARGSPRRARVPSRACRRRRTRGRRDGCRDRRRAPDNRRAPRARPAAPSSPRRPRRRARRGARSRAAARARRTSSPRAGRLRASACASRRSNASCDDGGDLLDEDDLLHRKPSDRAATCARRARGAGGASPTVEAPAMSALPHSVRASGSSPARKSSRYGRSS